MSEDEILELNLVTGVPYVFEFEDDGTLLRDYFLADSEELRRQMEAVAAQGKK